MVYFSYTEKVVGKMLKTLVYQGFDANGNEAVSKENQSNDVSDEQTNEIKIGMTL